MLLDQCRFKIEETVWEEKVFLQKHKICSQMVYDPTMMPSSSEKVCAFN